MGLNLDIDAWLRGIGLAQYAEMFRANDIDIELLARLSNDDLKEIGVESLGHRKKLLAAIATLPGAAPPEHAIEPRARDAAERRQVTVMFSDCHTRPPGSTNRKLRTRKIDPEPPFEIGTRYGRNAHTSGPSRPKQADRGWRFC